MATVRVSGEQKPRCAVLRTHVIMEHSFQFIFLVDLAIDRQIHWINLRCYGTFKLACERPYHAHVIAVSLSIGYIPFGHHERPVLVPIFFDVLHDLLRGVLNAFLYYNPFNN